MQRCFLFIRLSALGDVVVTLPALVALRRAFPDAAVDWLVEDRFAPLLAEVEGVDRVIAFPRSKLRRPGITAARALVEHLRALRADRYAAAIDFQGNLKGAIQLRACRAERRIGLAKGSAKEGSHLFASERVEVGRDVPRAARALALLEPLGIRGPVRDALAPPLPRDLMPRFKRNAAAEAALDPALRGAPSPCILLHPGTSAFGAFKRLPPERFAALADRLHAETGSAPRIIHGPGEERLAESVIAAAASPIVRVRPAAGIAGLIAQLRRADVLIAADSGPLHLAAALGVPTVGLFGPKDPAIHGPPFEGSLVVRNPVACSPCTLRRCEDPICMTEMEPEAIARATLSVLNPAAAVPR